MVDFNAGETISTAPTEVLKIMILQRLDDVLNSLSAYYKYNDSGVEPPSNILSARIRTLLMMLKPSLDRWINGKNEERLTSNQMLEILNSEQPTLDDLLKVFYEVCFWLDIKQITRVDTRQVLSDLGVETENEEKGY